MLLACKGKIFHVDGVRYLETKLKEASGKGLSFRREVAYLRNEIRKVKYDLKLCDDIYIHSAELEGKLREMNGRAENEYRLRDVKEHQL